MNTLLIVFIVLVAIKLSAELYLEWRNVQEVKRHAGKVPEAFEQVVDQPTYEKTTAYTLEKIRWGAIESVYDVFILLLLILAGWLPGLYYWLTGFMGYSTWGQAGVMLGLSIILMLPSLPFELWNTFKTEAKYDFNKTTPSLWVMDKIKGLLLSIAIGCPLLALLLWFFKAFPATWWIWGFLAFFGFQLLLMVLYPQLIVPLFNKLAPLPDGALKDRLLALGQRTGFTASTIQVIDGSKRSGHSNAYFSGFGRFRRIVLYDTLIEQLEDHEVEAVLAHEIGHYKKGHVPKMLVTAGIFLFVGFGLVAWCAEQDWFFQGFGFEKVDGMVPALLLFSMVSGLITFWLTPLSNRKSRKHEYEADAFARDAMEGDPMPLITSLRKMHEKNLSNLTPDPLYSAFHYSHPTLLEREASLLGKR